MRRGLATVLVTVLAAAGAHAVVTAGPAAAGPCDTFNGTWLGTWADDTVAQSGGVARFVMTFAGTNVDGTLDFSTGQTVLADNSDIDGTRALGSCSFSGTVGDLPNQVTVQGTVHAGEQEMSGAWAFGSFTGSWRAGRVVDSASSPSTTFLTTDTGAGVSAADLVETSVTSPVAGEITIDESASSTSSVGNYTILGTVVRITAPSGSAAAPLEISFDVHNSVLNGVQGPIVLFRNGVAMPLCLGATPPITADPCVSAVTGITDGLRFTVLTSEASTWFFGFERPKKLEIVTDKLLNAKLGETYTKTLVAKNVAGKVKWKKLTKLPKGLKLKPKTGVISGTPKKLSGTFTFKVAVIEKVKVKGSPVKKTIVERTFTLTVKP
jgi:hypothetical protein